MDSLTVRGKIVLWVVVLLVLLNLLVVVLTTSQTKALTKCIHSGYNKEYCEKML